MVRRLALAAIVMGCGAASFGATTAAGQTLATRASDSSESALAGAAFLERETYVKGRGPARFASSQIRLNQSQKAVDTLRIDVAGALRAPGGLPTALERAAFDAKAYDVTLIRSWPRAVSFESGALEVDVSPHAGVGVGSRGGSAEAGAMLTVGQKRERQAMAALKDMGVRDGSEYGDKGRWYLFAAASGRAVGLNMMRHEGDWDRAGWSTDPTGALIGDAHVGVGWRKGDVQSSFGVVHREVRGQHMVFGQQTRQDTVAAFTLSIRPQK